MPKVSKIRSPVSRINGSKEPSTMRERYHCSRCGRSYTQQRGFFSISQSPLYRGNDGYLTICQVCVDELFKYYYKTLKDEKAAMYRICQKLDLYWHSDIYAMLNKSGTNTSRVRTYISRANIIRYMGKTFDDTLEEEAIEGKLHNEQDDEELPEAKGVKLDDLANVNIDDNNDTTILSDTAAIDAGVDPTVVRYWGYGFQKSSYLELSMRFKNWTDDLQKPLDKAAELIYKQICLLEISIAKDSAAGRPIDKNVNTLNTLLGSANLKPSQRKDDELDASFDSTPFGVGIRMYENLRPIPEPDPEFKDVDGIVRYISIWFLGHLCKMLGIKNTYCKLYEQELEKLRVDRPDLEEEDDEALFNDIFGDDTSG